MLGLLFLILTAIIAILSAFSSPVVLPFSILFGAYLIAVAIDRKNNHSPF